MMAPFPVLESKPQFAPRRAEPDQITLSVTHASSTYATIIPLGNPTAIATDGTATLFPTNPTSTPTQTAQATLPRDTSSGSSNNTGVVVGAVLGSILGALVLIVVLYKCCFDNRSAAWIPTLPRYYDSESDSERSSRSSRVHRRGGGGDGFGRDNRRGERVKRPRRARTRRSRREESGSRSRSQRSYGTRYERRRSDRMSNHNGLLGWFLVPRTTPRSHRYEEKRHTRSPWTRGGARGTADD